MSKRTLEKLPTVTRAALAAAASCLFALVLCLLFAAAASLFEWGFPWAASHIPIMQQMSNYVALN